MEELRPFIQAKMMVACYSIDGWIPNLEPGSREYMRQLPRAFQEFAQSQAGVTNGQVAIQRVLSSFPEVDPQRLFTTGHSSAATLSLLLASKDSRISKCLAFAPVTDLKNRFEGILDEPGMARLLKGIEQYLDFGSPTSYVDKIKSKVWVAHARDDDNVPHTESDKYCQALRTKHRSVEFHSVPTGGHYADFLNATIPAGIEWLQKK